LPLPNVLCPSPTPQKLHCSLNLLPLQNISGCLLYGIAFVLNAVSHINAKLCVEEIGDVHDLCGNFYRAMLRRAQLCHTVVRLSVRPRRSGTRDHTGWNTSKIISRLISLRYMLELTQTWVICCNGNIPKIRVE